MSKARSEAKANKQEELACRIADLKKRTSLEGWQRYLRDLKVPEELLPAIMTQRPQLMPKPKQLSAEQCGVLYEIIGTLLDTNMALQEHTRETAQLVDAWLSAFKGLSSLGAKIGDFANFRTQIDEEIDE